MCSARWLRQKTAPRAVCRTLPGAGVDLARDEERDEHLGVAVELVVPLGQVVLVAAVGVAHRVRVVLEEVDLAADALLAQARLGAGDQLGQDPLPRLVVHDDVADPVALGRGVLGVAADVEVEAGAVLQEDVGRAAPRDHPPEQVARHLVGAEATLPAQREGHPVLVLDAEDAAFHQANRTAAYASSCASSSSSIRRKVRRPFPRLRMATSRSPAPRVRSGPASAAVAALTAAARSQSACHAAPTRSVMVSASPPEHGEAVLVGDRALVGDVVQLVLVLAQLGHQDLDLERLHLVGEDVAEVLRVEVGQRTGVDVLAAVGVPLGVGVANTGHAELVVLVVLADAAEGDAVVDLADLVQRARRVLGDDGDADVVGRGDERAATGDALLGVLGPVLHHLLGRHVVRHAHDARSACLRAISAPKRSATSSSGTSRYPAASTTAMIG